MTDKKISIDWYVVPHGSPQNEPKTLRLGLRPVLIPDSGGTNARFAPQRAIEDWPRFLLSTSAKMQFRIDGGQTEADGLDVTDAYRAQLRRYKVSPERASLLWKALFGRALSDLEAASKALPNKRSTGPTARVPVKYHDSAQLASLTCARMGRVMADSVVSALVAKGRGAVPRGRVDAGPPLARSKQWLRAAAAMYVPAGRPLRRFADFIDTFGKKGDGESKEAKIAKGSWAMSVLARRFGKKHASATSSSEIDDRRDPQLLPYSDTYLKHLLLHEGHGIGTTDADNHGLDPFAARIAERRLAYARQPAEQTNLAAADQLQSALGAVMTHPWLACIVGLVVDVDLPLLVDASAANAIGVASFSADGQDCHGNSPMTMLRNGHPLPSFGDPKSSLHYCQGLLNVSARQGAFTLTQIDIDNAPEQLVQSALTHETQTLSGVVESKIAVQTQPQRTVGISVIESSRDRKAAVLQPPEDDMSKVYLEHLLIGYLPDVQVTQPLARGGYARGEWQSLMRRRLRRVMLDGEDVTDWFSAVDIGEACLIERTRTARQGESDSAFMEGELFRWSLDGLGAGPAAAAKKLDDVTGEIKQATMSLSDSVIVVYDAEEAPPQRFGYQYRFGVRLMMVDGKSLSVNEAATLYDRQDDLDAVVTIGDDSWCVPEDPKASCSETRLRAAACCRFEPVAAPTVLLTTPPERERFAFESGHHLIVATGRSPRHTLRRTKRILVPHRFSTPDIYLRHGVFDGMRDQTDWPPGAFNNVVRTSSGDFPSERFAFTGIPTSQTHTEELYYRPLAGGTTNARAPYYPDPWATRLLLGFHRAGDDCLLGNEFWDYYDEPTGYRWPNCRALELVVETATHVRRPELGFDVVRGAEGLTVRVLPGVHLVVRAWHEINVERLRQSGVVEQMAQIALSDDDGQDLFTSLGLPASQRHDVDAIRMALVAQMGAMRNRSSWVTETPRPASDPSALVNLTSFWMINPYLEMTVTHALDVPQTPLALADGLTSRASDESRAYAPFVTADKAKPFVIQRQPGQTKASFAGHALLDRMTAARVDATAHWIDNPARASMSARQATYGRVPQAISAHLFTLKDIAPVVESDDGSPPLEPLPVELAPVAYMQRLDSQIAIRPDDHAEMAPVVADHDFGDTRARVMDVVLSAVSRDAGEFVGLKPAGATLVAAGQRVVLRSTKRPDPPSISYVVPAFNWTTALFDGGRPGRVREGGWFRVWLGTDWYSSGNGELLALVCWPGNLMSSATQSRRYVTNRPMDGDYATPPPAIEPQVTRWGLDPVAMEPTAFANLPAVALISRLRTIGDVAATGGGAAALDADMRHLQDVVDFQPQVDLALLPEFSSADTGTTVDGVPATSVQLALHRPVLDEQTGRMYVDIRIDPLLAYQPFVRLAFARYQPYGLRSKNFDLRLSAIVSTEFIQLMPERAASIGWTEEGGERYVSVAVAGRALRDSSDDAKLARSRFSATLEERSIVAREDSSWVPSGPEDQVMHAVSGQGVWTVKLPFERRREREYSVRIEEYELLPREIGDGKLVYFDRLAIRNL